MRMGIGLGITMGSARAIVSAPVDPTPLGSARWNLYCDLRDESYDAIANHGDGISTAITPRVGSGNLTPTNTPTWDVTGIGGRRAAVHTTGNSEYFSAHWVGTLINGTNVPMSLVMRLRMVTSGTQVVLGWGNSAQASKDFFEILTSSVNALFNVRNTDDAVVAKTQSCANLTFVDRTIGITRHASGDVSMYIDGVLQSGSPEDLDVGNLIVNQFRIGSNGRGGSPGAFGGLQWQVLAIADDELSDAEHLTVHNAIIADNAPAPAGTWVLPLGDSITLGSQATTQGGWRGPLKSTIDTNLGAGKIDFVGALTNGAFSDAQHSGYGSQNSSQIADRFDDVCEAGAPFVGTPFCISMLGTNNIWLNPGLANHASQVATTLTAIDSALRRIMATGIAGNAAFRLGVTTILDFLSTVERPGMEDRVADVNAALPALWDAIDTDFPSNLLIRADAYTALGGYGSAAGSNFADGIHPNATGYNVLAAHYWTIYGAHLASIAAP